MHASASEHWDKIYASTALNEVGWYQKVPETSLTFINELNLAKDAAIIDIGGGDSYLAPTLLELGYTDITVLDLSAKAIERAQERLGTNANKINWIVGDITDFKPTRKYDCWHDRAAFHFLLEASEINKYVEIAAEAINAKGQMIIGTFSVNGPNTCSGLKVSQYSKETLDQTFKNYFDLKKVINPIHMTPGGSKQQFVFCCFEKIAIL